MIESPDLRLESEDGRPWGVYRFIHRASGAVVGSGGFEGGPRAGGEVEIGYEIDPAWRGRGLATQAARALAGFAFTHDEVTSVVALTCPRESASTRVLARLGMWHDGVTHADMWRFRVSRTLWLTDTRDPPR